MQDYSCGCRADGTARCDGHLVMWCHHPDADPPETADERPCPPCWRAGMMSKLIQPRALPTRSRGM